MIGAERRSCGLNHRFQLTLKPELKGAMNGAGLPLLGLEEILVEFHCEFFRQTARHAAKNDELQWSASVQQERPIYGELQSSSSMNRGLV